MKQTIGLAEAKARLSELIARVEAGEAILISRNGTPAAELRPVQRLSPEEAVQRIRAIAVRTAKRNTGKEPWPATGRSVREIVHEGHRV